MHHRRDVMDDRHRLVHNRLAHNILMHNRHRRDMLNDGRSLDDRWTARRGANNDRLNDGSTIRVMSERHFEKAAKELAENSSVEIEKENTRKMGEGMRQSGMCST